jgi:hypothetical protein
MDPMSKAEKPDTVNLSRRTTLCGLAAAPLAAIIGAAPALAADDPIFAAIERHKAAEAAFIATLDPTDEVLATEQGRETTQADREAHEAASAASDAATDDLLATVPVSAAGARAALEYLIGFDDGYHLGDFAPTLLKSPLLAA